MEEDPSGDVGRLVTEMLRTVAWQQVGAMVDAESPGDISDTMMLARAIKDLASADKIAGERDARIRHEVREEAAETAAQSVRKAGLSAAAAADIRREILGIAA